MVNGGRRFDGEWEVVRRRNFRESGQRWDVFPLGGGMLKSNSAEITLIYSSRFPEDYSAKNFFELFGCLGKVVEVAISPRKNCFGRKFGFVRFVEVADGRLLAIKCDNVMILKKKIYANFPRFERSSVGVGGKREMINRDVVGNQRRNSEEKGAEVFR